MTFLSKKMVRLSKRGVAWDMPVWLIWSLIALLAIIIILAMVSGKIGDYTKVISRLFSGG